jgi:NAD-dependent deacetylase
MSETTGGLDPGVPPELDQRGLDRARVLLGSARRVVVLTGAGISTDSGIPDFRGPDGVWTRNPEAEKYSTIEYYLSDPDLRRRAWLNRLDNPAWTADPNPGHQALVDLEATGRLDLLVTQNIDGLHQAAGSDPDRVVEMHGCIQEAHCVSCSWRGPMQEVLDRVRAGEADPPCEVCGGVLKSATVFFGENLRPENVERAFAAAEACDLFVAVGTTLAVFPVARLVPVAARAGAPVIIINGGPTEQDELAEVVLNGPISELLPALVRPTPFS